MTFYTRLLELLVAGPKGLEDLSLLLREYDYSARCSLVWTGDYFAYRCRTCGLTPSMSLCGRCFTAGNHEGHDFNKFKSLCGGACDCGDAAVIRPSGICRFHGEDKVSNRPEPPRELVAVLEFLLPSVFSALMFWFWEQCRGDSPIILTEDSVPLLFFLHRLHSCGWVTQKLMADVLIDEQVFEDLLRASSGTPACQDFRTSVASDPSILISDELEKSELHHRTLLDALLFTTVKLCFPEGLDTLLIGLLAVPEFKEKFLDSYVDHYSRMASTLMITARSRSGNSEASLQMNNRIVHVSVQLFSGEKPALRMVKERSVHYIIVQWIRNMFDHCHTRLDDCGNMVVNCDGPLMQSNTFWPLTSDLNNLFSHKSITDILVEDKKFLVLWTDILKNMQFMNCFSLKEGSHIEYETMAFFHGLTMEIEVGVTSMWYIWQQYRTPAESEHCLLYTRACLECLANQLTYLGHLVAPPTQWPHPIRGPLSLHMPLSRHAACFLCLSVLTHKASLRDLMTPFLHHNMAVLRRLMEELANVLLGCHEVIVGYWVRNGQSIRQSIMHYMQSQLCYSMIDLDIFLMQVCSTLLHPAYLLNALVDQSRLLQGFCFHRELLALTGPPSRTVDKQPMAIEAWLTNLCWILDLRNNLGLTEEELLEKELVCFLAPDSRKRSDLSCLLPDRCGLPSNSSAIDDCLQKVANYAAPSCDNASGSLVSGHYFLRPELWHEKFDPVFYSLRISNRREIAAAMDKYRQYCRQSEKAQNTAMLWAPYRLPSSLPAQFEDLDNVLHSRHLHYLLFCLLSLFAYGDPLVTDESLALVVHIIHRAVASAANMETNSQPHMAGGSKLAEEPTIPKIDPATCTEAFLQATNRQAELEAMQFADADETDNEADSPTERTETTTAEFKPIRPPIRHLKWDISIVACPYPTTTRNILDNLTNWISVCRTPSHTVTQAAVEISKLKCEDGSVLDAEIPKPAPGNCSMLDNLLTLLVKVHSRLYWNQLISSLDSSVAQSSAQDSAFVNLSTQLDPQLLAAAEAAGLTSVFSARCMAILNDTNASNTAMGEVMRGAADPSLSADTPEGRIISVLVKMPAELRYFSIGRPAYRLPEERSPEEKSAMENKFGDGSFWVARLLDKIIEVSPACKASLKAFLERAKYPFGTAPHPGADPKPADKEKDEGCTMIPGVHSSAASRAKRKMMALERRKRLLDQMASKQRAFASNFLKDVDLDELSDDPMDGEGNKDEKEYECVICQTKSTTGSQSMVLLSMMCESGLMQQMRDYSNPPLLTGERMHNTRSVLTDPPRSSAPPKLLAQPPPEVRTEEGISSPPSPPAVAESSSSFGPTLILSHPTTTPIPQLLPASQIQVDLTMDTSVDDLVPSHSSAPGSSGEPCEPVYYAENRRWYYLALPSQISAGLPLLRCGVLLQTCGHAVHKECFQRYRAQSTHNAGSSAARWWASCPLCRRDVHHLLPLYHNKELECVTTPPFPPVPPIECLRSRLETLPSTPQSVWNDLVGSDEEGPFQRRMMLMRLTGKENEVAVLLRSQFETELATLLLYPSQYPNVARRCLFQQFMNYLRHIYKSPLDLLDIVNSLTSCFLPPRPPSESQGASESRNRFSPIFAICNDPSDILFTLLPHTWPNLEIFMAVACSCICLAYTRALVALVLNQYNTENAGTAFTQRTAVNFAKIRIQSLPTPFRNSILSAISCLDHMLDRLSLSGSSNEPDTGSWTTAAGGSAPAASATAAAPTSNTGSTCAAASSGISLLDSVVRLNSLQLDGSSKPFSLGGTQASTPELVETFIVSRVLPCLRLAALVHAQWQDSYRLQNEGVSNPAQLIVMSLPFVGAAANPQSLRPPNLSREFRELFKFLGLATPATSDPENSAEDVLGLIQAAALRSGLAGGSSDGSSALDELIHRWLNQVTSYSPPLLLSAGSRGSGGGKALEDAGAAQMLPVGGGGGAESEQERPVVTARIPRFRGLQHFALMVSHPRQEPVVASPKEWIAHLGTLMDIGAQLYPPRLIRPPRAFDDLFNKLHLVSCASATHRFQENLLCLVCGRLLCALCAHVSSVLVEHAFHCEGFAGVSLEINTSLVYVSLGPSICEWGSIYLDVYGEEDLDLKRGKPLFLNDDRFALLESQWITHSFRHVLKHWRYV